MKKIGLRLGAIMAILFCTSQIFAQITISGTVTDSDFGEPLPGVNIVIEGTTEGTVSDIDGNYSLEVPDASSKLTYSFVGMTPQTLTIGDKRNLDIVLGAGVVLDDIVITALGIKREKKTLGYSTQEVGGDEVTKVKNSNFVNSLSGKVAGLDIKTTGTLGASSNVIIRGSSSITGNNQALFVVDGVPVSNSILNTTDQQVGRGGYDYGNAASDINPEDIESVNVLKGAAATALYGSSAANGVVLITTKKGAKNEGIGISFSTGYTIGNVDKTTMPRYQKQYGPGYSDKQGWYSGYYEGKDGVDYIDFFDEVGYAAANYEDASFGAAFDPSLMVYTWKSFYDELGTYGQKFPYTASDNDATNSYYQTSGAYNANVAFSGGNDDGSFRMSYTYFDQTGILQNSNITKNTFTVGGGYDLTDRLQVQSNVSYIYTDAIGRYGTGYDNRNPNQSFRQWYNTGVDMLAVEDAYKSTGLNITWNPYMHTYNPNAGQTPQQPHYFDNYFFNLYQNYPTDNRSRVFGNVQLHYNITDWLNFRTVISTDRYDELREERIAVGSVDVPSYSKYDASQQKNQIDLYLETEQYFGADQSLSFGAMIGSSFAKTTTEEVRNETEGGLIVPGIYSLRNSRNPIPASDEYLGIAAKHGYFGRANFGLNRMLYLDLTGRYDISSTLPIENNSYFYPSAALSFVFSELFDSNVFDFGKIRLSAANVGSDTNPLRILDTYALTTPFGDAARASVRGTKNNPDLKPERKREIEAGIEMNFWRNKLGLDVSVYQNNTFDQIIPLPVTGATGYTTKIINVGEIQNQGIEVAVKVAPISNKNFGWDMNVNWAKNQNEVVELLDDQDNLQLSDSQGGITLNATVGQPYGALWGSNYVYHDDKPIVYPHWNGGVRYQRTSAPEVIGTIQPDWKAGINNTFRFLNNNVSLGFLIDIQKGGSFFSLDTWYGYATGVYDISAGNNRDGNPVRDLPADGGGIFIDGAVKQATDAEGMLMTDENGVPISNGEANEEAFYAGDFYTSVGYAYAPHAYHVYDASFVKLREASLTFGLPKSIVEKTKIFQALDLSLIGRNLWIIHKNSEYSDPEAGLSAGNLGIGNQSGAYPSVREIGISLKARF